MSLSKNKSSDAVEDLSDARVGGGKFDFAHASYESRVRQVRGETDTAANRALEIVREMFGNF